MKPLSAGRSPHESADLAIAQLAAAQHGTFSREQVLASGASRHMIDHRIRTGLWQRLHFGVYRLVGVAPSWRQSAVAALLASRERSAVCGETAAALLRLPDFSPLPVEIIVPRGRRRRLRGVVMHESQSVSAADLATVDGIRTTNATRTLIDLAGRTPELKLEIAVDDALRRDLTSIPRLRWRLDALGGSGRPGTGTLRAILDERVVTGVPQSPLETRVLAAFRAADLPKPVCQYEVRDGGRLIAALDFAWPDRKVGVEADGYAIHADRQSFEHDRQRNRALTALGWRIVSITSRDLDTRPTRTMEAIRRILGG